MSSTPPEATTSPIPFRPASHHGRPHPKPGIPKPKLRFECRDLNHTGALVFFKTTNPATILSDAVTMVLQTLYIPFEGNALIPPVRSITLILRPMAGVAYTTGTELDDEHKEIHFSLDYIANMSNSERRQKEEIQGVIVHEMVHCWQWNALGTAPGGLIEGVADFVRLRAALSPPHWKKEAGGDWDAGYQHTAYFLEWMEVKFGEGAVMRVNEELRDKKYHEKEFWTKLFGSNVSRLWEEYSKTLTEEDNSTGKPAQRRQNTDESEDCVLVEPSKDCGGTEKNEQTTGRWGPPPSGYV
ncbi:hypothetical protein MMC19_004656 [Ptychographa xylographoides]|nr:hypothetical protein [Ptychographa xylographoides]